MKIIHFCSDEKFIDRGISLFEQAFPGQNEFYIWSKTNDDTLKLVTNPNVKIINSDDCWWRRNFINFKEYDCAVFHNLYEVGNIFYANTFSQQLKIVSIVYGADFYNVRSFYSNEITGLNTRSISKGATKAKSGFLKSISRKIYRAIRLIIDKEYRSKNPPIILRERAFNSTNLFPTHVRKDFNLFEGRFKLQADWCNFSYYTTEDYSVNYSQEKTMIQIGNSSTATNNHLEVFDLIKYKELPFDILCPLNYGDEKYAQIISEKGRDYFGERFTSLRKFLPLEEYNQLQARCGIVIMNHFRQQAAGNIIAALFYGAKVFLNSRSTLYHHFKELGCHIYDVDKDLRGDDAFVLLSKENQEHNISILQSYYSRENIVSSLRDGFKLMLNDA